MMAKGARGGEDSEGWARIGEGPMVYQIIIQIFHARMRSTSRMCEQDMLIPSSWN